MSSVAQRSAYRGEKIDVGGHALRVVTAGPPAGGPRPTILLEHGAFGCAADWAVVQERLAARGLRSLAYDRAGLGHSDPGPTPRDGHAIVTDLDALVQAAGEPGPFVLVGHSMGGLMVRLFALTHPDKTLGVVLVDAITPDVMKTRAGAAGVHVYGRAMRMVGAAARFGVMRPVSVVYGNLIGLEGQAAAEKRAIYGSASHAHWASEEVANWPRASDQAGAAEFPKALPVAVVTAGVQPSKAAMKAIQVVPALASQHGYVEHVAGARHASLLGRRFADPVVRGIEHVLAAVGR